RQGGAGGARGRPGGRRRSCLCARAARPERRGAAALLGVREAPLNLRNSSQAAVFADNAQTVGKRLTIFVALAGLLVLLTGAGGAGGAGSTAGASARAVAIRVVVPGQSGSEAGSISSPPYHAAFGSSFAYPSDGSVVTTGSISASVASDSGTAGTATATSQVQSLSLFGGEVTASVVKGAARGSTRGRSASGDFSGATISGLTALGAGVSSIPN